MTRDRQVEISCPACGRDALLLRKPKYEGFTKVGEMLSCASCGHEFGAEEDVPFRGRRQVQVFTDADRSADVEVFGDGEADRLCRYCLQYVVNPFMQWCGRHRKEVEATDTCADFERREEEPEEEEE